MHFLKLGIKILFNFSYLFFVEFEGFLLLNLFGFFYYLYSDFRDFFINIKS